MQNEKAMVKIRDFHKGQFANEGKVYFPLFDRDIKICIDFDVPMDYAVKCVEHLESLNDRIIADFCKGAVKYCEDFRDLFEECDIDIPENITGRDILKYITPQIMIVEKPEGEEAAYHMECWCDWEEEHALEWTVRGNELLYVGSFSDERPWRDREYFKNASWNYAELE